MAFWKFGGKKEESKTEAMERMQAIEEKLKGHMKEMKNGLEYLRSEKADHPAANERMKNDFADGAIQKIDSMIFDHQMTPDGYESLACRAEEMAENALKISPKQAIQIRHFYGEGFSRFSKAYVGFTQDVSDMKSILESKPLASLKKIRQMREAIEKGEEDIGEMKKEMEREEKLLRDTEKEIERKRKIHIETSTKARDYMEETKRRHMEVIGEISSSILSARRVLVKYAHDSGDKTAAAMAETPFETFQKPDECAKALERAIKHAESGKIIVQDIEKEKAMHLLKHFPELQRKAKEIPDLEKRMKILENEIEKEDEAIRKKERNLFDISMLEREASETRKRIASIGRKIKDTEESISSQRAEIDLMKNDYLAFI